MADLLLLSESKPDRWSDSDFSAWVAGERLREVLEITGGGSASAFVRTPEVQTLQPGPLPGPYLTFVESPTVPELESVDRCQQLLATDSARQLYSAIYDRRLLHCRGARRPTLAVDTTGILVVLLNNLAPNSDDAFEHWYNNVHVPDVVGVGPYWAGRRYINRQAGLGDARFLAVYQTDWADPRDAYAHVAASAADMRLWDRTEQVHVAIYDKVADLLAG